MDGKYYTSERSLQILISLLKQHKIKKCVLSPGTTNLTFVASLQQDPWFECFSSVDERSAAYIACGLAAESGEPVVLSCTGATASRNYLPGLTEAYYRKLPVLAVTSTQDITRVGHLIAQVIDRRVIQNDIALLSEYIPVTNGSTDEWSNTLKINRALLELCHHGGGPVHLNMETTYSRDFSVKELPQARIIRRIMPQDIFPEFPKGRIAVLLVLTASLPMWKQLLLMPFALHMMRWFSRIIPVVIKVNIVCRSLFFLRKRKSTASWQIWIY